MRARKRMVKLLFAAMLPPGNQRNAVTAGS